MGNFGSLQGCHCPMIRRIQKVGLINPSLKILDTLKEAGQRVLN